MNTSKYQPHTFGQIVFANDESRQLIEDIVTGVMPFPFEGKTGILLYGTFGSGKTTLARILPEAIEQGQTGQTLSMPYEFFGCQQGHVGTAFTAMVEKQTSKTSLNTSGHHYFIFDEVDSLSKTAQAGMKTTLNSPRSIFILTTNNISQLDKGVKDRCVLIDMNAPPDTAFLPLARQIATDENVVLNDTQLLTAIAGNNGSFRSVIFQVLRLAKRTARQNDTAATAAAAVIQQAANKK
jgi:DNA polymerase III delta prime subunit